MPRPPPAVLLAGTIDCPRVCTGRGRLIRAIPATDVRAKILARHFNQTAEDSLEQLSDEPWGRRRPRLRRVRRRLWRGDDACAPGPVARKRADADDLAGG